MAEEYLTVKVNGVEVPVTAGTLFVALPPVHPGLREPCTPDLLRELNERHHRLVSAAQALIREVRTGALDLIPCNCGRGCAGTCTHARLGKFTGELEEALR
jgi:hypothetical protein